MAQHRDNNSARTRGGDRTPDPIDLSGACLGGADRQASVTQAAIDRFKAEVENKPGFRWGSARAPGNVPPGTYMHAVEVTSWLQVPSILNKLENEGAANIRLLFPKPVANEAINAENIDGFIREQNEISDFLKQHHSRPIETLKDLLAQKIESSLSLRVLRSEVVEGHLITGSSWVEASLLSSANSKALNVSNVFGLGQKSLTTPTTTEALRVSVMESAGQQRPHIVTVPSTNRARLEALAMHFNNELQAGERYHCHRDEVTGKTKIWIGPYSPKLNTTVPVGTPCPEVTEYSLPDFLRTYLPPAGPTPPGPTPPGPTPPGSGTPPPPPGTPPAGPATRQPRAPRPPGPRHVPPAAAPIPAPEESPKDAAPSGPTPAPIVPPKPAEKSPPIPKRRVRVVSKNTSHIPVMPTADDLGGGSNTGDLTEADRIRNQRAQEAKAKELQRGDETSKNSEKQSDNMKPLELSSNKSEEPKDTPAPKSGIWGWWPFRALRRKE